VTAYCDTFAIV